MTNLFTILYVDDENENLVVFKTAFKKSYRILTALSATEALDILVNNTIHVVITDQRMPEITGVEFLEKVKSEYPQCIRLLMTGYTDSESIISAINRGSVFYFIKKPWVREELFTLLEKCTSYYALKIRRKELERQWTMALRDLETFFYKSYHDLKGPITTQLGLLNMIKMDGVTDMTPKYLDLMEEAVLKLDKTLAKVQCLSSVLGNHAVVESFEVSNVISEILHGYREEIQNQQIRIEVETTPDMILQTDRKLMKALLEVVIENSILYMNKNQESKFIKIVVLKENDEWAFAITDNGIGMSSDVLDKVFDAFYKGTVSSKGGGLGLYLGKKIAEKLRGSISLSSVGGQGTVATVRIPELTSLLVETDDN